MNRLITAAIGAAFLAPAACGRPPSQAPRPIGHPLLDRVVEPYAPAPPTDPQEARPGAVAQDAGPRAPANGSTAGGADQPANPHGATQPHECEDCIRLAMLWNQWDDGDDRNNTPSERPIGPGLLGPAMLPDSPNDPTPTTGVAAAGGSPVRGRPGAAQLCDD